MKRKKKKPIYETIRKVWAINPKTRLKGNDKAYNRKKTKQQFRREIEEME